LDPFVGFVGLAAALADWGENDLAGVLRVAPGAAAAGRVQHSFASSGQGRHERKDAAAVRRRSAGGGDAGHRSNPKQADFHCRISFQSAMTSAMADPVHFAVRSMPILRTAAFNLRESISPAVSVKRLARSLRTIKEAQVSGNATTKVEA
jgi:hypothetical protein